MKMLTLIWHMCLNSTCVRSSIFDWALDSYATDHMHFDLNILFDLKEVSVDGLSVNISNGTLVLVKFVGKCYLMSYIVLKKGFVCQ